MNKKFSTLVAGLAMISAVASAQITKTDGYTMLKSSSSDYLAVYGAKSDSVVVKTFSNLATAPKASIDSAMWKVTEAGVDATGNKLYSFTNKKTGAVLSFAAKKDAKPNLAAGVDKWSVTTDGKISAYYSANGSLGLVVSGGKLSLGIASAATAFTSEVNSALKARTLAASDLGDGFTVFSLNFGEAYQENIFEGKELVATQLTGADADYVQLQEVGADKIGEKDAYFGLDTTKYTIAGQKDVFGYKFAKDSTWLDNGYHTVLNGDFQKFKFIQDLSNDKVAVYVKNAPVYNTTTKKFEAALTGTAADVQVVYAQVTNSKVLTVSKLSGTPSTIEQGVAPSVKLGKGTPATLPTGDGVYFIKVKSGDEFKYVYATASGLELKKDAPNAYNPAGQFYVVAKGGKYQFVERNFNQGLTTAAAQIYKVTGKDAYRVDAVNSAASASLAAGTEFYFEYQKDIKAGGKEYNYMATKYLDKVAVDNFAYTLNLISGTPGVDDLYAFTSDSVLMIKSGDAANAAALRIVVSQDSVQNVTDGLGARALGDTLYHATYMLKERFSNDLVASENGGPLKLSDYTAPLEFVFNTATTGGKYQMATRVGATTQYVFMNVNTANLILSDKVNYFDFVAVEAPEYASIDNSHKRFGTNGKFLTMNPLNFFAEVKNEGQDILKSTYETDNFSLWVQEADTVIAGKPLYFITTSIYTPETTTKAVSPRYYMVSLRDSNETFVSNGATYYRVGFSDKANIVPSLDNNALFAFKTTQDGGYLLENQKELNRTVAAGELKTPYVGVVNNVVVMSNVGVPFTIENAPTPVSNEQLEEVASFTVIAGEASVTVLNAANILGQTTASAIASSDNFVMPASKGIVVVSVDGETAQKVVVK